MAVNPRGFSGAAYQFDESSWAQYQMRAQEISYRHGVWSGGAVSPGSGRAVNVAIIDGIVPGIWFTSDSVTSVPLDANAGSNRRIDYIVAEANWATDTVAITKVTGTAATNPVAPALTQTAGTLWQMPLARVTVQPNAATIAATDIATAIPGRRIPIRYTGTVTAQSMRMSASSWNALGTVDIADPGWPYRMQVSSSVRFGQTESTGYMRTRVLDVDNNTILGEAVTSQLAVANGGNAPAVMSAAVSAPRTGPRQMRLEMLPAGLNVNEVIQSLGHDSNHFTVLVLPA